MKEALVVDDHPVVREGVRELLQRAFPTLLVKCSQGGEGVLQEICEHPWAFVVLDINLPGGDGIDIIKQTRASSHEIPIVVFSLFSERQYAARALRAGAVAYLSKNRDAHELVEAVKMAIDGRPVRRPREASVPLLSDREVQVLTHFAKGMTRKEISQQLEINEKTVSTYKARLLQKLGLRNLVDLVRYANEEG